MQPYTVKGLSLAGRYNNPASGLLIQMRPE